MSKPHKYAAINEAPVYQSVKDGKGVKKVNSILLGTYVSILETDGDWIKVDTAGPGGWMHKDTLADTMGLKVFVLDVGQGDGILIEIGNYKILIDAGPNNSMHSYLTKWQYKYLLSAHYKVHLNYVIVSHFDLDHYKGLIAILKNKGFSIGTVCHPGILKFASTNNPYNSGLGNTIKEGKQKLLTQIFSDLLKASGNAPFNRDITNIIEAMTLAKTEGRLSKTKRYEAGDTILSKKIDGHDFKLEVLAPFTETLGGKSGLLYWENDSKTINGNSLVIKLSYGSRTMLLGGDLNTHAELYLLGKYKDNNPFEVDVAKSCHHGSSDFTEKFMQKINAFATIISSGDNEGHAHPRADAIGCAGKYSRSLRPLVYSTELARSVNLNSKKILFGMINLRCNGSDIYISQMKEVKKDSDLWDAYEVK